MPGPQIGQLQFSFGKCNARSLDVQQHRFYMGWIEEQPGLLGKCCIVNIKTGIVASVFEVEFQASFATLVQDRVA